MQRLRSAIRVKHKKGSTTFLVSRLRSGGEPLQLQDLESDFPARVNHRQLASISPDMYTQNGIILSSHVGKEEKTRIGENDRIKMSYLKLMR